MSEPEDGRAKRAGAPGRSGLRTDAAVLTVVVGAFTAGAIRAFPQMDDAMLLLLLREKGPVGIGRASLDRPLVGKIWQAAAELFGTAFWPAGFVTHFLLWLAFGLLACGLWRWLFPRWGAMAPVVGALTVAPIGVRVQLSTVTITAICILSVVPVYAAVLAGLRFVDDGRRAWLAVAAVLTAVGGVLTEYGAVAAAAGAVLLCLAPEGKPARRRGFVAGVLLAAVASGSYLVYLKLADFSRRPLLAPGSHFEVWRLVRVPFTAATRFWDAAVGELGRSFSNFDVQWTSKSTLLAALFGFAVAALVWWAVRPPRSTDEASPPGGRRVLAVAAALAAGVAPISVMRPIYRSGFGSRFQIPVLPIAAVLTVAVLLILVRPRFHRLVAGCIGFLVGLAVATETSDAIRQRQTMAAVGAALRPIVASREGVTLAVLSDDAQQCHTAQVCTGAATRDWPPELSRRVWVEPSGAAFRTIGTRAACGAPVLVELEERGFERGAPNPGVVWVQVDGQRATAERFCLTGGGA